MTINKRLIELERRLRPPGKTYIFTYLEDAETGEMVLEGQTPDGVPTEHDEVINIHFVYPDNDFGQRVRMHDIEQVNDSKGQQE